MVVRRRRVAAEVIPSKWPRGYFAYGGPAFLIVVGVLLVAATAMP